MSDNVNHPSHYTTTFGQTSIECIDITRHLPFDLGNAFKYIWRAGHKGDKEKALEDLEKARWYLNDYKEHFKNETPDLAHAKMVFSLLKNPVWRAEGSRYKTLRSIVELNLEYCEVYLKALEGWLTGEETQDGFVDTEELENEHT